ncbi:MAG TPA: caspase family protein [Bacteroidales bacterium]|nr:caspase family protein [Bacteroidales bacterium]
MDRALLVGINKYPTSPLNGCVNDISDMAQFLQQNMGFTMDSIRMVADERATKANILQRLSWLLNGLRAGDRVVFHYSGHGVQVPTRNAQQEVDRLDEAICPVDFDWTEEHMIKDKEFNQIFSAIPAGVDFIWISDSCHSGDLWKEFTRPDIKVKTLIPPVDINWRLQTALKKKVPRSSITKSAKKLNLVLISGCKDHQTSADALINKRYNGALTYFLLKNLKGAGGMKLSLSGLVKKINEDLKKNHYTQQPELEGNSGMKTKPFLKA